MQGYGGLPDKKVAFLEAAEFLTAVSSHSNQLQVTSRKREGKKGTMLCD
jgi:hypothetical protein